eukprot:9480451-Pyramimonas_sp.AAC.1
MGQRVRQRMAGSRRSLVQHKALAPQLATMRHRAREMMARSQWPAGSLPSRNQHPDGVLWEWFVTFHITSRSGPCAHEERYKIWDKILDEEMQIMVELVAKDGAGEWERKREAL